MTDVIFSTQTEMFQLDAGIVISPLATKIIIDDTENCSPSKWTTPLYTGKALLRCARKANFRIWDPIDEVSGNHLILYININVSRKINAFSWAKVRETSLPKVTMFYKEKVLRNLDRLLIAVATKPSSSVLLITETKGS